MVDVVCFYLLQERTFGRRRRFRVGRLRGWHTTRRGGPDRRRQRRGEARQERALLAPVSQDDARHAEAKAQKNRFVEAAR